MRGSSATGKRVLVTGAASGIGRAIAEHLANAGYELVLVDVVEIETDLDRAVSYAVDLTDQRQLDTFIGEVPRVDYLVNAAGKSITKRPLETSGQDWDEILAINAKAPFQLMQAYGFGMPDGGAIVNIASVSGKMATNVNGAPYNASKAAILALTKTFAYSLAPQGVRVNAVCPGVTKTPMLERIWEADSEITGEPVDALIARYLTRVPLGRLGEAEEIAAAVAFMLSDEARYITGQSLNVCGGLVMS